MSSEHVCAVVPALDEHRTITAVVTSLDSFVDETIVVDDGSTDGTAERAREAGATVLEHETNRGYDRSIGDGFSLAVERGATIVVTFDADGQHYAEDLPAILDPIRSGQADVVVGRRPRRARATERLFSVYTRARLGISDPLCGFKAYRTAVYNDVGHFDTHSTIGTQLMIEAELRGYDVTEVPIQLGEREDESRFGKQLESNWKIFRAMTRLLWFDLTSLHVSA